MSAKDEATCAGHAVHTSRLTALHPLLSDPELAQQEAERFRALGDPTRLRILAALTLAEMCVCDLGALLGTTQTATSQHLKVLRTCGLVRYRRQGRAVYYRLADPALSALLARLRAVTGDAAGLRSG